MAVDDTIELLDRQRRCALDTLSAHPRRAVSTCALVTLLLCVVILAAILGTAATRKEFATGDGPAHYFEEINEDPKSNCVDIFGKIFS